MESIIDIKFVFKSIVISKVYYCIEKSPQQSSILPKNRYRNSKARSSISSSTTILHTKGRRGPSFGGRQILRHRFDLFDFLGMGQ